MDVSGRRSRRVVVTGIGLVTPIGAGRQVAWEGLLAGRSGFSPVSLFDTSRHSAHIGAEIRGFDPDPWVRRIDRSRIGRASKLGVAAARMALEDAGLDPDSLDTVEPERAGVAMGTTSGEPLEVEKFNDRYIAGELDQVGDEIVSVYPCSSIATQIARELGFAGVNVMIPTACAAGNYALAHAFDALRAGKADLMLAGGSDAFSRITYTGFARLGAIAPERCQPFDKNRKGMIPGEGAGVLVLEPLDRALERGATVYAELVGYGLSCDAHHMTAAHPQGDGAVRAMEQALKDAGLGPEDVGYVSAHGTGTPTNDKLEAFAIRRVFGASPRVPISSVKSMIGHTMGAASAIEAAVCSLAIHTGLVPPTMNMEEPDPDCDFDCVPNAAREHRVDVAMNNAYAFGGNNASVIFRRVE
ncbi:MAG TPA: beta-ketoacyl-[acyl-carrier-protein] synthase family protein [Thermoanaerobaculia bacterium]|nr:beta-ketoacyl-[acyl-carrier-protein] synthase family protein [Thermoanaerobaculia bacterium]